jgi:PAS domain S-box-containing protein
MQDDEKTKEQLLQELMRLRRRLAQLEEGAVTARKRAEEKSQLNELRLEALLNLNRIAEAPFQGIAEFAMEEAIRLTGSTIGYLGFVNEDESMVTIHAWSKATMEECRVLDKNPVFPVATAGLWGEAVRQRQAVITNDYAAPHPWKRGHPEGHVEVTHHMGVPIFDGKKIVIVAGMGNKPSDYNESDVRQVTLLMEGMWRIIQRQRTEEALRESEAKFRSLFDNMTEGVALHELIYDDQGTSVDYRIVSTNPAFEKHTGLKGELIHGRLASAAYGTGAAPYLEIYAQVAHSGEAYAFETFFPPLDRHFHISVNSPKRGQFVTVFEDITERKRVEEIFKLNESRLEALLKLNQMAAAPLREIASFALEEAINLTGSTIGYLAFMNEDESVLTMHAWSKDALAECAIMDKPLVYPVETTGLWGEAVRQRRAVITNDYAAPNPWKKGCPEGHVQVTKHMNAPIFDGNKIVILAGVGNKPTDYDESDVRQLTLLMEGMWRIIQRNRVEETLRESEEKYRGLIETTNTGYVIVDTTGKVLDANPEYVRLTGHGELGEILGRSVLEWTAEQDRQKNAAAIKHCLQTGLVKNLELYYAGRGGRSIQVEINATAITTSEGVKFLSLVRDISDRKKTEEALRDNEQFLADIFNSIQDGLSVLDPDLNIIRVNPAMEKFGYVQPLVGKKCYEVYHGQSSPCEICPSQQTLLTGKACRETVKGPPSGPERVMEVLTYPLKDRTSGDIRAVIEYVRDVTDSKRAEEERLRFSKLESLATLAGGIAHDFNNILTAIMGNISLATLELQNTEQSRQRLTQAEKACMQAQTLARQLLTFARGGAPVKEPVAVENLITESAVFSSRGSKVRCEFAFPDNLWAVEADPGQINQVFQNLVINAIQAMPTGGTIKFRGENLEVEAISDLPLSHGRYVKISVQDQGVGMPADYLQKIFDPYFTTKQTGSGLGLATTYSIVKNHQGHISVESKLGAGTAFLVYLPACDHKITAPAEEDKTLLSGKGTILVMDDEEMVRQVLEKMLGLLGYDAKFSGDGSEALELFTRARESGQAFDAVILDLTVPGGMGGKEVMERLLKIDPRVKAIVSSGYSEAPIMAEFEKYGFRGIIAKPYKVSELGKVLDRVCNGEE